MDDNMKCPQCQGIYFATVARWSRERLGASVPNSNVLSCANCHGLFEIIDGQLKTKNPRQ